MADLGRGQLVSLAQLVEATASGVPLAKQALREKCTRDIARALALMSLTNWREMDLRELEQLTDGHLDEANSVYFDRLVTVDLSTHGASDN